MGIIESIRSDIEPIMDWKGRETGNKKIVIVLSLRSLNGLLPKIVGHRHKLVDSKGNTYESCDKTQDFNGALFAKKTVFEYTMKAGEPYLDEETVFSFTYKLDTNIFRYITEEFVYRNEKWFRQSTDKCTDDNEGE